jgi:hypothetical protein
MAIETLRYQEFNSKSDVWAFGVVVWEVCLASYFINACSFVPDFQPWWHSIFQRFKFLKNVESILFMGLFFVVVEPELLLKHLETGTRLENPPGCSAATARIMTVCCIVIEKTRIYSCFLGLLGN